MIDIKSRWQKLPKGLLDNMAKTNAYCKLLSKEEEINEALFSGKLIYDVKKSYGIRSEEVNACSRILKGFKYSRNADVVNALDDGEFHLFGLTNCDIFNMGISGNTFKDVRTLENKIAGGSSSGAAVSAKHVSDFSLCTDTGGSARFPAFMCDLYGFKPSYEHFSRQGIVEYDSSLDQPSIMSVSSSVIEHVYAKVCKVKSNCTTCKRVIIVDGECLSERIKDDLVEKFECHFVSFSEIFGYSLFEVGCLYAIISASGFFSKMSRYGSAPLEILKNKEKKDVSIETKKFIRTREFEDHVKQKIIQGSHFLKTNTFFGALAERNILINKCIEIFKSFDLIVMPCCNKKIEEDLDLIMSDKCFKSSLELDGYYTLANLTFLPSLVAGPMLCESKFGLQLLTRNSNDHMLFEVMNYITSPTRKNK